ncbi:TadE/TadG family type IV pilus assembly protein [Devosia sp. A449]
MSAAGRKLLALLRRLPKAQEGVAAVEFALILPIMLMIYIGSVEASALISMDRRVQSVTGTLGDLVARTDTSLSRDQLDDYFRAASAIMTPYPANELHQVLSQVNVAPDGKATVDWSQRYDHNGEAFIMGQGYAKGATYPLPAAMVAIAKKDAASVSVIVSEVSYSYLPLYGIVFELPVQLHRENFFMPRFGGSIAFK